MSEHILPLASHPPFNQEIDGVDQTPSRKEKEDKERKARSDKNPVRHSASERPSLAKDKEEIINTHKTQVQNEILNTLDQT